jgi:large subunit ribosomal protein L11
MNIKLLIDGGDMKPGPAIAQKIGPLGINMGKVISEINNATTDFKGMKVPVEIEINEKTKAFTVKTSSPPTSELLKKEINIETGSGDHKKIKVGNASIEDVIKVTKIKFQDMLQKEFKSAVKSVLGTCTSIGILVENESPKDVIKKIEQGEFEKEIASQSTATPAEKREKLGEFFSNLQKSQEEILKKEKAAEEEKEKEKAAAEEKGKAGEAKTGAAEEKKEAAPAAGKKEAAPAAAKAAAGGKKEAAKKK